MLAHDWAEWEATKRSYELFARYVLPRFEERSAWRSQSMDWMRANREAFKGGKARPRVFLGRRSLPSRYVLTPPFPGNLAGYFPTRAAVSYVPQ
jgi:hypothetical protein